MECTEKCCDGLNTSFRKKIGIDRSQRRKIARETKQKKEKIRIQRKQQNKRHYESIMKIQISLHEPVKQSLKQTSLHEPVQTSNAPVKDPLHYTNHESKRIKLTHSYNDQPSSVNTVRLSQTGSSPSTEFVFPTDAWIDLNTNEAIKNLKNTMTHVFETVINENGTTNINEKITPNMCIFCGGYIIGKSSVNWISKELILQHEHRIELMLIGG